MRVALLGTLLGLLLGCGDALSSSSTSRKPQDLWADLQPNTVVELTPTQLGQSGTPTLSSFTIPGQQIAGETAFDTAGNLWVPDGYGTLNEYTPHQLAQASTTGASITPAVTLTIPGSAPAAVTFDGTHNLWVADVAHSNLFMFPPSILGQSGYPSPTDWVSSGSGADTPQFPFLFGPRSLAFDQSGALWVAVSMEVEGGGIIGYRPSTLSTNGGGPAPDYLLYNTPGTGEPLCIAFDSSGNLWVADAPDTIAMFSASAMSTVAKGNAHPVPSVVLIVPGTAPVPGTLAFDNKGNLWVATFATKQLIRFPVGSLSSGGPPDITISLPAAAIGLSFDSLALSH